MLHIAESLEAAEFVLRLTQRRSDPAKEHRAISPPSHVSAEGDDRAVEILDRVGAAKRPIERPGDSESLQSESLLQPFTHRSRGARMIALERPRQALELALGEVGVGRLVGLIHRATDVGVHGLGKMTKHVADLVEVAAMHDGQIAEELGDGPPDSLAPIDHEQTRPLGAETPLDQIAEKTLGDDGILGATFAKTEHVLGPVGSDSQSDQYAVVAEEDAIDDH